MIHLTQMPTISKICVKTHTTQSHQIPAFDIQKKLYSIQFRRRYRTLYQHVQLQLFNAGRVSINHISRRAQFKLLNKLYCFLRLLIFFAKGFYLLNFFLKTDQWSLFPLPHFMTCNCRMFIRFLAEEQLYITAIPTLYTPSPIRNR